MTKTEPVEADLELNVVDTAAVPADEGTASPAEVVIEVSPKEAAMDAKLTELESRLSAAEQKAAEYLDNFQRSQAAFANFRKRTEAEQVTLRKVANAALLTRLLPVADDFRRAFQVIPTELQGNAWIEGILLIQRKVTTILEVEDVKPIEVRLGDSFDPLFHQAIFHQEVAGFAEGQIVTEVERGYILGDRVLRPSMVVVAKAPAQTPPQNEDEIMQTEPEDQNG